MGIDMSGYKMIYKDQVYNVVGVMPSTEFVADKNKVIKFIEATYIDEDGELKIIADEAFMFKFVRR